jgi:hypothetical protein
MNKYNVWITLDDGSVIEHGYCTRLSAERAYNALVRGRYVDGFPLTVRVREIGLSECK